MRRVASPIPYWRWVSLPADRRLNQALADIRVELASWIDRAQERLSSESQDGPRNFLEAMLLARDAQGRVDMADGGRERARELHPVIMCHGVGARRIWGSATVGGLGWDRTTDQRIMSPPL